MIDDVNGVIIGGEWGTRYEFWSKGEWPTYVPEFIYRGWFDNDEQAEQFFKTDFPDWYKKGVEMRVYERH